MLKVSLFEIQVELSRSAEKTDVGNSGAKHTDYVKRQDNRTDQKSAKNATDKSPKATRGGMITHINIAGVG